jgi:6-methylsalicylate decarboxylase
MRIDIHQHIWTAPLLQRLMARDALPLVRQTNGLTVLHCAAERPYVIDAAAEAATRRAALVREDGLDLALVAISSPIGIEALPRDSALELIDAYLEGGAALPREFAAWGPVALDRADPDDVDDLLARGCVGISLPAGAIADPLGLDRVGPILERTANRGMPLFVHPGRGRTGSGIEAAFGEPLWWRALTDYIAQMQAAWLTFASFGRRDHPNLEIVFSMLAGCAPLHSERLQTRGGPSIDLHDPRTFYDTSSYGPAAIETMARRVGPDQLLYGSDRPVIEPMASGHDTLLQANGTALFARLVNAP